MLSSVRWPRRPTRLATPSGTAASGATALLAVLLTGLALATAVWLYTRYPGFLVSGVANTDPKGHVDFETFWRSTVALLHGADVYHTGAVLPNLNPPLLSLLLAPFGMLPLLPSYWTFTALTVVLVSASVLAAARELRLARGAAAFGLLTLWVCSPLQGTLLLGQIYGLLLAGLTAAWLAQRHGRPLLATAVLGVVVALKPSLAPLLLIPLGWGRGRRRAALVAGIGSAVVSSLIGVLAAGPASALEWLRLATGTPAPDVDANASLPGLVARLGGPGALGWVVTIVVVAASLYWSRAVPRPGGMPRGAVEPADAAIFAVAAGCLLAAPIAWLNYQVMLWPGALVLLRGGRWRAAVPLLVFPIIPVAWGNLWQATPHTPTALLGRSLYCAILLGFWLALVMFPPVRQVRAGRAGTAPEDLVGPDPGSPNPGSGNSGSGNSGTAPWAGAAEASARCTSGE